MNTGYKFLEIGINVGPSSGDHPRSHCEHDRCLSKRGSLQVMMKYLQNASKRIQRQFHKRWTANGQSLHTDRCYARTSQFFIRMHDRNDATPYV